MSISDRALLDLYSTMLRIRRTQERIESLYSLDKMITPIHLCIGQEAVAAGVCAHLTGEDFVSSNHRGHGHYLAKGGNLDALVAELHCKVTGCSKGRGGSMHLVDARVGYPVSSAIVGGGIPVATGLGLSIALKAGTAVSVAFFGDGAADEGTLYESINFAVLKRLPVVFVYENNQFSVCSRVQARQAATPVFHRMPPESLFSRVTDGNDAPAVYEAAGEAVARARKGEGPSFIECLTYRLRGHAGSGSDTALGYRTAEEIGEWEKRCPIRRLGTFLREKGLLPGEHEAAMETRIAKELDDAFRAAQDAPLPESRDLTQYLFAE